MTCNDWTEEGSPIRCGMAHLVLAEPAQAKLKSQTCSLQETASEYTMIFQLCEAQVSWYWKTVRNNIHREVDLAAG